MTVRVDVRSELLEWARARSGIGSEVWESRYPRYEAWLSGQVSPTVKQISEFARKTYTPVGYFFLDEPPDEDVPLPDFRTRRDRPVATPRVGGPFSGAVSGGLLDTVYACQARQEWYRDNQLLNREAPLSFVGSAGLEMPIPDAARAMRDVLGWTKDVRRGFDSWNAALTCLRENAEAAGVLVMISGIVGSNPHRRLDPEEFRGFALVDPYASVVFVNGADSKTAQVFTLAHELVHIWLGETALSDLDAASIHDNRQERWCNQVAAELLVPMREFRSVFDADRDHREQLQWLAEWFRVSTGVILGRMREAGALTWDHYMNEVEVERGRITKTAGRGGGGNFYYTKPVQVSKRFARQLIASTLEGRTTYTEAFRLLNINKTSTLEGLSERLGVS